MKLNARSHIAMSRNQITMQASKSPLLTKDLFDKLDKDRSGTIDLLELREALGQQSDNEIAVLMERADLNKDGVIDYAEYDRLMNMQKYDDGQGGNLYVRNAIKFGLLKPDSILNDCVMVGNKGFDPLNCATNEAVLKSYREAELKHGRLAMLAAAGWPISELVQPWLSAALRAPDLLATGEKAPSILNGGLDRVNPAFFMAIIIFSATVELVAIGRDRTPDFIPGDLGFDPLRLYKGKPEATKRDLELKELNNGRLAMLAITAYALEEFITKASVTATTPFLFNSAL